MKQTGTQWLHSGISSCVCKGSAGFVRAAGSWWATTMQNAGNQPKGPTRLPPDRLQQGSRSGGAKRIVFGEVVFQEKWFHFAETGNLYRTGRCLHGTAHIIQGFL